MVDFEKNGAKSSLMVFLPTFVPKKIGNVFANVDFHVNPLFAALCLVHKFVSGVSDVGCLPICSW